MNYPAWQLKKGDPAAETSLTALRVAELAAEAGVPPGVFNVVPGSGPEAGEPLGRHPDVDMVSFTGSTATGRRFLGYSAESNLKEVTLEMGGKNPCIVLDDAGDLDTVAAHVVNGAFWNMGQNCSAASRLIVQRGIRDALMARIIAHAREWPMGDPLNPENRVLKRVEIEDARMASEVTELLMGNDVPPRKKFIYDHADEAEIDA